VGLTGPNGVTGATGATGSTGAEGKEGKAGTTGATGAEGKEGKAGAAGATGATGATGVEGKEGKAGATGAIGPTGATGPTGAPTPEEILFSSGGAVVSNKEFVGVGAVKKTESQVQQIVSEETTYTTMRCFIEKAPKENITFTLHDNGEKAGLTCTVEKEKTTGSGGGTATLKPGDLVDVATPETETPAADASFSISS
jgi:hypothetical protein